MKHIKKFTVKEWKKFAKFTDDIVDGQSLTMQEILLDRYKIILTDHVNKRSVGKLIKPTLKDNLKSFSKKITLQNFDAGMKKFDQGMNEFNSEMKQLSKGLGGSGTKHKLWSDKKNTVNLVGKPKSLWSKPVQKRKRKKKRPSQDQINVTKLMGNKGDTIF